MRVFFLGLVAALLLVVVNEPVQSTPFPVDSPPSSPQPPLILHGAPVVEAPSSPAIPSAPQGASPATNFSVLNNPSLANLPGAGQPFQPGPVLLGVIPPGMLQSSSPASEPVDSQPPGAPSAPISPRTINVQEALKPSAEQ